MIHKPVLLKEVVDILRRKDAGLVIGDFTVGGGGHLSALLSECPRPSKVIALDQDAYALKRSEERLKSFGSLVEFYQMNFKDSLSRGWPLFDRILLDLGVSSFQLDDASRGFSFQKQGPLDMRMNPEVGMTAAYWLATCTDNEFIHAIRNDGEEPRAAFYLKRLRQAQSRHLPMQTTEEVVKAFGFELTSKDRKGRHPLTQVFQALRIQVNDELGVLESFLTKASSLLKPGGRLAIISFHSLEDRRVKWAFREDPHWKELFRRPLQATEEEATENPRARSAKLRAAEKINDHGG